MARSFCTFVSLAATLLTSNVYAYNFAPTEAEWYAWPDYCQARYVTTNIGAKSKWVNKVGPAQQAAAKSFLGKRGILGVHHYCAGIAWLNRARMETDPYQRKYKLKKAFGETMYSFERLPESHHMIAPMAVQLAAARYEAGETDDAMSWLDRAIQANPKNPMPYSAKAVIQRKSKRLDLAKQTLLEGNEAVGGTSAEICYNLGLILFELGEVDAAAQYAKEAYRLGYPLPGLKNKLVRAGRWQASVHD